MTMKASLALRTRRSRKRCSEFDRGLRAQRSARTIELQVVLGFRSSYLNQPRALTNFGIGPLVRMLCGMAAFSMMLGCVVPAFAEAAPPPKIDAADTAWMITATALVLMMTLPGLAL